MRRVEETFVAEGKTPRKLYRLCSEKVAYCLASRALPVIELYFTEDEFFPRNQFSSRSEALEYISIIKKWYWEETYTWLGHRRSLQRLHLSQAMAEILDYFCAVRGGPRDQQLFAVFIFQTLFQFEAGNLLTRQAYGVDHLCRHAELFLERLGPLNLTALSYSSLIFYNSHYLAILLRHTPYLTTLHIKLNFDESVLNSIRVHCRSLEDISMEVASFEPFEEAEEYLCKAFFDNMSKDQILHQIKNGNTVSLSFPKLQVAKFYTKNDSERSNPKYLIFFLQHFYPMADIKWNHDIEDGEAIPAILRSGILCPPFVKQNDRYYWDRLIFHLVAPDDEQETPDSSFHSVFLKANHISYYFDHRDATSRYFLEGLLSKFKCKSLLLTYHRKSSVHLRNLFSSIGKSLTELFLKGSVFKFSDSDQLYAVLDNCSNLKVLALELDVVFKPVARALNISKIEALSIKCKSCLSLESSLLQNIRDLTRRNEILHSVLDSQWMPSQNNSRYDSYGRLERCANYEVNGDAAGNTSGTFHSRANDGYYIHSTTMTSGIQNSLNNDLNLASTPFSSNVLNPYHNSSSTVNSGSSSVRACNLEARNNASIPCYRDQGTVGTSDFNTVNRFNNGNLQHPLPSNAISNYDCSVKSGISRTCYGHSLPQKLPDYGGDFNNQAAGHSVQSICSVTAASAISFLPILEEPVDGYGVLEYKALKEYLGSTAVFWGYRRPAFAFYGSNNDVLSPINNHPDFGSNCTFSKRLHRAQNVCIRTCNEDLPVKVCYFSEHYSHVKQEFKDCLAYNRTAEDKENPIQILRFDTEFSDPVPIIKSLILASPNLKILDLPDLAFTDIVAIFNDNDVCRNLSGVNSLYLSSQFTRSLVEAISELPSLKLVKIDVFHGVDNFLKFKKSLRLTNLTVEIGEERIVKPGIGLS